MKLWLKYSAGILFGAAIYLVIPKNLLDQGAIIPTLAEIALRVGYYIFTALLVVNLPLATLRLFEDKKFWPVTGRILAFFAFSTWIASCLGIAASLIAPRTRLPMLSEAVSQAPFGKTLLLSVFPENMGSLFLGAGTSILPILVFAYIAGLAMAHDCAASRPVANLLDSGSRILYTVNSFITEILGILLIPVSIQSFHVMTGNIASSVFSSVLITISLATLAFSLIIIPAALFFLGGKSNPFPLIYSSLPGALAALLSGNIRFASGSILRQARENLGIRRRYTGLTYPANLLMGRAGTAFIAALSSVVIFTSYSPLILSFPNLLLLSVIITIATFLGGTSIDGTVVTVLMLTCRMFGRGFENGYLVVLPLALLLSCAGSFIDALWMGCTQALSAGGHISADRKPAAHFI